MSTKVNSAQIKGRVVRNKAFKSLFIAATSIALIFFSFTHLSNIKSRN